MRPVAGRASLMCELCGAPSRGSQLVGSTGTSVHQCAAVCPLTSPSAASRAPRALTSRYGPRQGVPRSCVSSFLAGVGRCRCSDTESDRLLPFPAPHAPSGPSRAPAKHTRDAQYMPANRQSVAAAGGWCLWQVTAGKAWLSGHVFLAFPSSSLWALLAHSRVQRARLARHMVLGARRCNGSAKEAVGAGRAAEW